MIAGIRILLVDVPAMLRDILENVIARQPDMMLLRDTRRAGAPEHWRRPEPDAVIVATRNIGDVDVADCLNRWARSCVVVIETSGRDSVMYELKPHTTPLGALSPDQLVSTIREQLQNSNRSDSYLDE
jgi:DNA-binding NarL/FixJ family response regulator